jgi:hypothetical protein
MYFISPMCNFLMSIKLFYGFPIPLQYFFLLLQIVVCDEHCNQFSSIVSIKTEHVYHFTMTYHYVNTPIVYLFYLLYIYIYYAKRCVHLTVRLTKFSRSFDFYVGIIRIRGFENKILIA